jgi:hypothetical protein
MLSHLWDAFLGNGVAEIQPALPGGDFNRFSRIPHLNFDTDEMRRRRELLDAHVNLHARRTVWP